MLPCFGAELASPRASGLQNSFPDYTFVMPCFVGCLALFFPRIAIILVWLFSDYLGTAYQTVLWPLLGFIFLPLTTLAYAFAINANGSVSGIYLVIVVVAVLFDLGLLGAGGHSGDRWRRTKR